MPTGSRLPAVAQLLAINAAPCATLERLRASYGDRFTVRVPGVPPLVFLANPVDARAVFQAPADVLHPGEGGSAVEPIVGPGSFMLADEREHLDGRSHVRAAFSARTARRHHALIAAQAQDEVAAWPHDAPVALSPRLRAFTLSLVLRTIFGETAATQQLAVDVLRMLDVTATPVIGAPPTRHVPPFRGAWRRFLRQKELVDASLLALIDARRARPTDGGGGDTLALLLASSDADGRPLSRAYIRDAVMSIVLAGHETTASALAWAITLLAHHPHVQTRLTDEIREGEGTRYMTATIFEVLRHRPVFLFAIPRTVKAPISIGGETYGVGDLLLPCIYLIHHDPRHYPEPDAFRPERFLDSRPDPAIWMPWGGAGNAAPDATSRSPRSRRC